MTSSSGHQNAQRASSISPKQPVSKRRRDWYPYYAGFTEQFVEAVLHEFLRGAENVLDPWSGSGTTTVVCLNNGVSSKGLDINPALTVIARARLVPKTMKATLTGLANNICEAASSHTIETSASDLLHNWLTVDTLRYTRGIEAAIHDVCQSTVATDFAVPLESQVDDYPVVLSFFYTALFSTVRSVLSAFRTTNPMWIKTPSTPDNLSNVSLNDLTVFFRKSVDDLADLLSDSDDGIQTEDIPFTTGNATRLTFRRRLFDGVITSPPYATRLDYIKGTLPELAVLGATDQFTSFLRAQVTGSPVVRHVRPSSLQSSSSESANDLLAAIEAHSSKGSKRYYFPWMRHYLLQLEQSIAEINRTVTSEGTICIVVQDNRYKEVHINLQQIVTELFAARGRTLTTRIDHPARNFRFVSPNLSPSTSSQLIDAESLLVFGGAML